MPLLSHSVQPPLLTLLNSSADPPLSPLFQRHVDRDLPDDSIICVVRDDVAAPDSVLSAASTSTRASFVPHDVPHGSTVHQVVHLQSPTVPTTYIQAGAPTHSSSRWKGKDKVVEPLGVELPWLGLQVKRLGKREFAFEVGVVDTRGNQGVVRFSSFQRSPRLHLPVKHGSLPLLCVPLKLPEVNSPTVLTPWLQLSINLPTLLPLFQNHALLPSPPASSDSDDEDIAPRIDRTLPPVSRRVRAYHDRLKATKSSSASLGTLAQAPSGGFGSVSYVRVYANCRARRIWFAREPGVVDSGGIRDEWGLYASEASHDSATHRG